MPEIKHNFSGGKLNKDVDERLVPNGQYRDAMNIQVSTSEGSDVGAIQNILGNERGCGYDLPSQTGPQYTNPSPISIDSKTIGSISDEKNDALYWLVAGPSFNTGTLTDLASQTYNTLNNICTAPAHLAKDMIMRKTPNGCEPVLVDKWGVLIPNEIPGATAVNTTMEDAFSLCPGTDFIDHITIGMTVELLGVDNLGQIINSGQSATVVGTGTISSMYVQYTPECGPNNTGQVLYASGSQSHTFTGYTGPLLGPPATVNPQMQDAVPMFADSGNSSCNAPQASTSGWTVIPNRLLLRGAPQGIQVGDRIQRYPIVVIPGPQPDIQFKGIIGSILDIQTNASNSALRDYVIEIDPNHPNAQTGDGITFQGSTTFAASQGTGGTPGVQVCGMGAYAWNMSSWGYFSTTGQGFGIPLDYFTNPTQQLTNDNFPYGYTIQRYSCPGSPTMTVPSNNTYINDVYDYVSNLANELSTAGACTNWGAGQTWGCATLPDNYEQCVSSPCGGTWEFPAGTFSAITVLEGTGAFTPTGQTLTYCIDPTSILGPQGNRWDVIQCDPSISATVTVNGSWPNVSVVYSTAPVQVLGSSYAGTYNTYIEFQHPSGPNSLMQTLDSQILLDNALDFVGPANNPNHAPATTGTGNYQYLYFHRDRILNFDKNRLITGLNIVDDMLFWTDGETEPKKINIPRSIEGTNPSGDVHTELVNKGKNICPTCATQVPLAKEHVTVIRKAPEAAPHITFETGREEEGVWRGLPNGPVQLSYTGVITITDDPSSGPNNSSFISGGWNFGIYGVGDSFRVLIGEALINGNQIITDFQLHPDYFYPGANVVLKAYDDSGAAPLTPVSDYTIKGVIKDWQWNQFDSHSSVNTGLITNDDWFATALPNQTSTGTAHLEIEIVSINGVPPTTTDPAGLKYVIDAFSEDKKPFESKFPRFATRYKYEDGEYSTFSPFSKVAFIPGGFDYHPKKGYNLGMQNTVTSITISDFIKQPPIMPDDVVQVDILYKEDGSPEVYLVDSINVNDDSTMWVANKYQINSDTKLGGGTLPSNQLLRVWDNVPKKAKAQEVVGSRIVYGNYTQNYDLLTQNGKSFYPTFNVSINDASIQTLIQGPTRSIKSLREYQLGVVFVDEYGRETPVLTSKSGAFSIEKDGANRANQIRCNLSGNSVPSMSYYKFYIKETSGEYYNMAMDRFYDAQDDNVWLSFPSSDRNKIKVDDFIILKKGAESNEAIVKPARYKVLAIENEAPTWIKQAKTTLVEAVETVGGTSMDLFYDVQSGEAPISGSNMFACKYAKFNNGGARSLHETINEANVSIWIEFGEAGSSVRSKRYRVSDLTVDTDTGTPNKYYFKLEKPLGEDVEFLLDANGNTIEINSAIRIIKYLEENKPEFDGKFFVKIYDDEVFSTNVRIPVQTSTDWNVIAQKKLYYMAPDHKARHDGSDFQNDYAGTTTPTQCAVFNGDGGQTVNETYSVAPYNTSSNNTPANNSLDFHQSYHNIPFNHEWYYYTAYFRNEPHANKGDRIGRGNRDLFEEVWFINEGREVAYHDTGHWKKGNLPSSHGAGGLSDGCAMWYNNSGGSQLGLKVYTSSNQSRMDLSMGGIWPYRDNRNNIDENNYSKNLIDATLSYNFEQESGATGASHLQNGLEGNLWTEIIHEDREYHNPNAGFINNIIPAAKFRFKEDPTQTIYTIKGNVETYNAHMYDSGYDINGECRGYLSGVYLLPENYNKKFRFWFEPAMTAWRPVNQGALGPMAGSPILIDLQLTSTNFHSSTNNQMWLKVQDIKSTCINNGNDQYLEVGMILEKYGHTSEANGTSNTGTHTDGLPLVVTNIVQQSGGAYKVYFDNGGYNHAIEDKAFALAAPVGLEYARFTQGYMNGLSPNSARNITNLSQSLGVEGMAAVGYTIEFLQPAERETVLPTKPAVFETEPSETVDNDIYYEASNLTPLRLTASSMNTIMPVGSRVTYPGGAESLLNVIINGYVQAQDRTVKLYNAPGTPAYQACFAIDTNGLPCVDPTTGIGYPAIEVGDKLIIHRDDGSSTSVIIENVTNAPPPFINHYVQFKEDLFESEHVLDWHNCFSFRNGVESNRIRDAFNLPFISKGVSVSTVLESNQYKEDHKKYGLIYSGLYNSTTDINNLNQFIQGEKITKDINPTYGSIQKLFTRNTDLITLCEDKVLKILANKDAVFNADGNTQLTATENVLGQTIPFAGEYGISKNPESFASESYRAYFSDKVRGSIIRLSMDGLTAISDHGMKDWFRDKLKITNQPIIGSYDDYKDEYNITLKFTSLTEKPVTVSFREDVRGWSSMKSFFPENGISCANNYYTFDDGNLWLHHSNSVNRNTFYDTYTSSSFKVILNEAPGSVKKFKTLNYEGSQSKVNLMQVEHPSNPGSFLPIGQYATVGPNGTTISGVYNSPDYHNLSQKDGWYVQNITTDLETGSLTEFIEKEGKWFNYIRGHKVQTNDIGQITSGFDQGGFGVQGVGRASAISFQTALGCIDSNYLEYTSLSYMVHDQSLCLTLAVDGCMDANAINFDCSTANNAGSTTPCTDGVNRDDGSCLIAGCTDPTAFTYNPLANYDDGSCSDQVYGCTDCTQTSTQFYATNQTWYNFNCNPLANVNQTSAFDLTDPCVPSTPGCATIGATNYNPNASIDDGSCNWDIIGCSNPDSCSPTQVTPWQTVIHDPTKCDYCNESPADNFTPTANCNTYCAYCEVYPYNFTATNITDTSFTATWDPADISGMNFLPSASISGLSGPAPVVKYELKYRFAGSGGFIPTPGYIIDPSTCNNCVDPATGKIQHTITGLNPNVTYKFRVRPICENSQATWQPNSILAFGVATTIPTQIPGCTFNGASIMVNGTTLESGNDPNGDYANYLVNNSSNIINNSAGNMNAACNYNANANHDDGSCVWSGAHPSTGVQCNGCQNTSYQEAYTFPSMMYGLPDLTTATANSYPVDDPNACVTPIQGGCGNYQAFNYPGMGNINTHTGVPPCEPFTYGCLDTATHHHVGNTTSAAYSGTTRYWLAHVSNMWWANNFHGSTNATTPCKALNQGVQAFDEGNDAGNNDCCDYNCPTADLQLITNTNSQIYQSVRFRMQHGVNISQGMPTGAKVTWDMSLSLTDSVGNTYIIATPASLINQTFNSSNVNWSNSGRYNMGVLSPSVMASIIQGVTWQSNYDPQNGATLSVTASASVDWATSAPSSAAALQAKVCTISAITETVQVGCTNQNAANYNSSAVIDDGMCVIAGGCGWSETNRDPISIGSTSSTYPYNLPNAALPANTEMYMTFDPSASSNPNYANNATDCKLCANPSMSSAALTVHQEDCHSQFSNGTGCHQSHNQTNNANATTGTKTQRITFSLPALLPDTMSFQDYGSWLTGAPEDSLLWGPVENHHQSSMTGSAPKNYNDYIWWPPASVIMKNYPNVQMYSGSGFLQSVFEFEWKVKYTGNGNHNTISGNSYNTGWQEYRPNANIWRRSIQFTPAAYANYPNMNGNGKMVLPFYHPSHTWNQNQEGIRFTRDEDLCTQTETNAGCTEYRLGMAGLGGPDDGRWDSGAEWFVRIRMHCNRGDGTYGVGGTHFTGDSSSASTTAWYRAYDQTQTPPVQIDNGPNGWNSDAGANIDVNNTGSSDANDGGWSVPVSVTIP